MQTCMNMYEVENVGKKGKRERRESKRAKEGEREIVRKIHE